MASDALIALSHVRKTYNGHVALHDLSLDFAPGRITGLLGPNGAGKTTLLRLVLGLLTADRGRIRLFGRLRPGSRAAALQVGYMPQALALYDTLTVAENVRFFGRLYGVGGDALDARCAEVLGRVALTDRAQARAGELSGGMQRRAMLATALVHRPRLLILDEPTAGVDPLLRVRFWDWFAALAAEGTSVVVTTHHIAEAVHCQEVIFLREGRVLERGEPGSLVRRWKADDLEGAFVRATEAAAEADGRTPGRRA